jgi:hypothetical protein
MNATITTIQQGNQLPREWAGKMRAATARTPEEAQAQADKWGAEVAFWLEPSKTLYALPQAVDA